MPRVFQRELHPDGFIGLWHITESEAFFQARMTLTDIENAQLNAFKGHRRVEWLAGRWLLHLMSGRAIRGACLKDEFGKPYLENSQYQISISHSREMASVIAAPKPVGIDIQGMVPKIQRLAPRFMNEDELESLGVEGRMEAHAHLLGG